MLLRLSVNNDVRKYSPMSKRPNHWKEVESRRKMIQRKTLDSAVPCSTSTFFLTAKNRFNSLFIIKARQLCDVIIAVGRTVEDLIKAM